MPREADLQLVDRFAKALDREDYDGARSVLSPGCVYLLRGARIEGPEAIIASYRGNGDEANARFESIEYGSNVREGDGEWVVIEFWDELAHLGRTHRHCCEQWVVVESGRIVRIEHRDLDGEVESLTAFQRRCLEDG